MFAVIRTGGKQYKVAPNDVVVVEKLPGEAGAAVVMADVLMVSDGTTTRVGRPLVAEAEVAATVVEQTRGDKVIVFKLKRRIKYRRKKGHRQELTVLRITGITAPGMQAMTAVAKPRKAKPKAADVVDTAEAAPAAAASETTAPAQPARKRAAAKATADETPKSAPKAARKTTKKKESGDGA